MCYYSYKALYFWQFFSFAASAVSASLIRRSKRNLNAFYSHRQSREVSWKLCFRDYVFVFTGCLLRFLKKEVPMSRKQKKQNRKKQGGEKKRYPVPNRNYKSSLFTMVFSNKKELLGLYNAVRGKQYKDPGSPCTSTSPPTAPTFRRPSLSSSTTGRRNSLTGGYCGCPTCTRWRKRSISWSWRR